MTFECDVGPEGWRIAVIIPLYKGKWKMAELQNYSLQSVVGKIFAPVLVDRVHKLTVELIVYKGRFKIMEGKCGSNLLLK